MTNLRRRRMTTLLQAMTALLCVIAAAGLVTAVGCIPESLRILLRREPGGVQYVLLSAGTALACGCCLTAMGLFLGVCGRMKRITAFTAENSTALRRISGCCMAASACLLPALAACLGGGGAFLLPGAGAAALMLALTTIALMIRTVYLLMLRAQRMQQDAELTI